jgi:hypothetical protein|tara:strand:- start:939 stop:1637 length:699 start_codon:yes stop_codon:yes gene_type:complete
MGRKKTKNYYWTEDTEQAIIKYNGDELDENQKNKLYNDEIEYPFNKLAENIINTFKFTYFDDVFKDVQHEVVVFLIMNMHKYDHTKGSKAFSYFSVVAKNYLILNNNANYKKYKSHDSIDAARALQSTPVNEDPGIILEESIRYFEDKTPEIFSKHRDRMIAYAIIDLMKARETIEDFNKKAIYILLREMTNVETSQITKVLNVLRKHMKTLQNNFHTKGSVFPISKIDKFS